MGWHSDNGVDVRVAELFAAHIGHACEVGANDGKRGSNTLAFEELGWTVLCVEANPHCAYGGHLHRKLWRSVACGAEDLEEHDFSLYREKTDPSNTALGIGSRFDANLVPSEIIRVPVRRLDRVLEEAGFWKLDYLAVDVEGWEPEVMAGFSVERWQPRVIVLESWYEDKSLVIPGYAKIERKQFDNIYLREAE